MRTRRFRWMGSESIDVILMRVEGSLALATSAARRLLITRRWTDVRRRMIGRRRIVVVIVVAEVRMRMGMTARILQTTGVVVRSLQLRSFLLRLRHGC
jgi:hypothetical protein